MPMFRVGGLFASASAGMPHASSTPTFDFFRDPRAGSAVPAGKPTPLSPIELGFYVCLIAVFAAGICGVGAHFASFQIQRVAFEDCERQAPYLLGHAIHDEDRVVGVSFQQVFQAVQVERRVLPPEALEDTALFANAVAAAAPAGLPDAPIALHRPAVWRPRGRRNER